MMVINSLNKYNTSSQNNFFLFCNTLMNIPLICLVPIVKLSFNNHMIIRFPYLCLIPVKLQY